MRWQLCSAVLVCAGRRLRPALAANPLLALLAGTAAAVLPGGAVVVGGRLADGFAGVAAADLAARVVAGSLAATAAAAGIVVGLVAPEPTSLGRQLAAAPVARSVVAPAVTLLPVLAASSVLALPLALFAAAMAGVLAAPLLLAAGGCALLATACAEGARAAARRAPRGAAVAGGALAAWAFLGHLGGAAALGPAAALGEALTSGEATSAAALGCAACVVGVALWWVGTGVERDAPAAAVTARLSIRVPPAATAAVAAAVLTRVCRHAQLRLHLGATVALPVGAAAVLRGALGFGGAEVVAFAAAVALTAAAILPAAAFGLADEARWLLRTAPQRAPLLASATAAAGVAAAVVVVAADGIGVAAFARADPSAYLQLAGAAAFVLGCAAFAGGLVPWRPDVAVQQVASYGALVGVVLVAWFAVGRLEGILAAAGVGETAFGLVVGSAVLGAGVVAAGVASR